MIQFLKNIWNAQKNARDVAGWNRYACELNERRLSYRSALMEIASSNPKNTNGTVRKHVRIARDALGWRD